MIGRIRHHGEANAVQDQARAWAGDGALAQADGREEKQKEKSQAELRKLVIVER